MVRTVQIGLLTAAMAMLPRLGVAQPMGTFSWQLQPYCNRVTVSVRQDGALYTLDGHDDLCGATQRAPLVGLATLNPDQQSIEFGLHLVLPGGAPVHVQAHVMMSTLGGPWSDSAGHSGTLVFGANTPSLPVRPAPAPPGGGDITGVTAGAGLTGGGANGDVALAVDPAIVQSRVTTVCGVGQAIRSVGQDGTAVCEPIPPPSGGDITGVAAGTGLTGGGASGEVSLNVWLEGSGGASTVARSDHTHGLANNNTRVGDQAMLAVTSGLANTAVGHHALLSNITGWFNTAVGQGALASSTASNNTAIGSGALQADMTGASNTAVGVDALVATEGGSNNTAVGRWALRNNVSGTGNIAIGLDAGVGLSSGDSNVYIQADAGGAAESNTLRLGREVTRAFVAGIRGVTTGTNTAVPVVVDVNGQLGTVSSSARTKDHIADLGAASRAIFSLHPVRFTYKQPFADGSTPVQYGLIAEEVAEVMPELVALGADGQPETVKYHVLPTLLLAEVQRLERERMAAAAERVALARQVAEQARELAELRARLEARGGR